MASVTGRNDQRGRLRTKVLSVWMIAALGVLVFAASTAVGPILLSLSRRHGIHLGDVAMLVGAVVVAGGVTARLVRQG